MPVDSEAAIVAAAQALRARHGFGAVLVTRGNDGMTLVDATARRHFPAEAAEVYDVSGAGDTAVATLAAALAGGAATSPTAVRLANIAAGVVVGKVGTAVAREADLLAALSPQQRRAAQDRRRARRRPSRWSAGGSAAGGSASPTAASTCCTPATCICWSRRGRLRPAGGRAQLRCQRAAAEGRRRARCSRRRRAPRCWPSLASVDLVCVFEEDTPRGADRRAAAGPADEGRRLYARRGGGRRSGARLGRPVALAELLPGHSTTATLARLRG